MRWFRKEATVETPQVKPHEGEMYEAIFKWREKFVAHLVNALPLFAKEAAGFSDPKHWQKFVDHRDYLRKILDDWYDEPETIDAMQRRIDALSDQITTAKETAETWVATNRELEDSVRERLPLTAEEATDVVGSILEDVETELVKRELFDPFVVKLAELDGRLRDVKPTDGDAIYKKIDGLYAPIITELRERIDAIGEPQGTGLTDEERELVEAMKSHLGSDRHCPPHHWIIGELDGGEQASGTCQRCGVKREDFDPVGARRK